MSDKYIIDPSIKKPLFFYGVGLVDFSKITEQQAEKLIAMGCPYIRRRNEKPEPQAGAAPDKK